MSDAFSKVEELTEHIKEYVNNRVDSLKLSIAERLSNVVADMIAGAVAAVVFLFFLVFVSLAGAYALSLWLDRMYAGFLIVGGFYLLMAMVVWLTRERLIRIPVMNNIIRQLFKEEGEDDDEKH